MALTTLAPPPAAQVSFDLFRSSHELIFSRERCAGFPGLRLIVLFLDAPHGMTCLLRSPFCRLCPPQARLVLICPSALLICHRAVFSSLRVYALSDQRVRAWVAGIVALLSFAPLVANAVSSLIQLFGPRNSLIAF